ncbi:phosphoribosylglycinamide formyltransferase [Algiphilus sp.]|uniref:phosphoribosylglycinamide formyltransferase n=1 Tax=Algiphilus sp. TaxID=1872431 RepID=UPI0025BA01E8|nr:phosphoribosylglycinamide formyltransferase [Algiphilus sp.]MCK5770152.1 phosphoribosylglycinamide formyltransferase [Algiphilus sp.]
MTARLCVVVSGRGRNLRALQAACDAGAIDGRITRVIGNRPDAPALAFAREAGLPVQVVDDRAHADRGAFDRALRAAIADAAPDWVPLAGFMRILGDELVEAFAGRMLNIHPSLLPRHRGLHTHRAAIAAGDAEHGASVHFVTGELDGGPLIIQGRCSVEAEDDEQSLARRVLETVELRIYPQAVAWACAGRLQCRDGHAWLDGSAEGMPKTMDDLEQDF